MSRLRNALAALVGDLEPAPPKPPLPDRNPRWRSVRREWLWAHGACAACGSRRRLEVHHIRPFHLYPELELDVENFITLCEGDGCNCHITFGHAGNWLAWNDDVISEAALHLQCVRTRLTERVP